jgi:hypothetical protein
MQSECPKAQAEVTSRTCGRRSSSVKKNIASIKNQRQRLNRTKTCLIMRPTIANKKYDFLKFKNKISQNLPL